MSKLDLLENRHPGAAVNVDKWPDKLWNGGRIIIGIGGRNDRNPQESPKSVFQRTSIFMASRSNCPDMLSQEGYPLELAEGVGSKDKPLALLRKLGAPPLCPS